MSLALWLIVICGALSIVYGVVTTRALLAADAGNERMQEISAAVREGAQAYLKRQYITIAIVGVVITVLAWWLLGIYAAIGFVIGAVLSGAAGFIGTVAAALVPADQVAAVLSVEQMPGWIFLSLLTLFVWLCGLVALSPITTAVFLGSLVTELGAVPADPTLMVLAIAAGTAICTLGAPFASGTLMLARASGYSGVDLTWRWNLAYTLASMAVLAAVYALLTSGIFM